MKILCLIQCTNLGGMEQSALLLLEELQNMGHQCEVQSLQEVGELGELLARRQIPASSIGYHGKWGWRSFLPLRRLLKTKQADAVIMVGHNLMATLALGNLGQGKRILTLHFHHEGMLPPWLWKVTYRAALRRFKFMVYPCHFIMDEALEICPFLQPVAKMIPYPVALPPEVSPEEKARRRSELGFPAGTKMIGNAGWLIPRKRWDIFLQVGQLVAAKIPEARFIVAGDGPELANLKKLALSLGIEDRVIWIGWQKNLEKFYQSLDLLLFNSDWDAVGRTPLEAMSYGVPVVASVVHGGLREIIDDESCGFVLDSHDVPRLAAKAVEILADEEFATRMGRQSRAKIEQVGSPRRYAESMLQLLEKDAVSPAVSRP